MALLLDQRLKSYGCPIILLVKFDYYFWTAPEQITLKVVILKVSKEVPVVLQENINRNEQVRR
jgi:hypothetical protein